MQSRMLRGAFTTRRGAASFARERLRYQQYGTGFRRPRPGSLSSTSREVNVHRSRGGFCYDVIGPGMPAERGIRQIATVVDPLGRRHAPTDAVGSSPFLTVPRSGALAGPGAQNQPVQVAPFAFAVQVVACYTDPMSALPKTPARMNVAEFLAWDPPSAQLWQLVDGEPQAMAPANRTYGAIHSELGSLIRNHLAEIEGAPARSSRRQA
jgi:hypothetical protein